MYRIETDRARFREIVRGRLRKDLRKYLSTTELLGRRGERYVSIPVPQIELPRFHFGENKKGVGQGAGEKGDPVPGEPKDGEGSGAAGEDAGTHILEVEVELEELAHMLGEELELPDIQPRGDRKLLSEGGRYNGVRQAGPQSLRHFRRTYRNALKRSIAAGEWDPARPRIVPIRDDQRYRARKSSQEPDSSAVIFHVMDVSGSMGREQKDIVRIKAFWIDTWLRSQYKNLEVVYVVHDAVAKVVDQDSFFHLRESGGTKISSAYELVLSLIQDRYRPEDWNVYPFHYSDGDNWSARDTERCIHLLRDEILPRVNQFCYGQVKSAYGSGQFKKDLDSALEGEERLVTASVNDREGIPEAIKAFLGEGALMVVSKTTLPPHLAEQARRIERVARDAGLDFFDVHFEMLDAKDVNAIASYGGFPVRYPSWRFGMEFERMEKGRRYGLSKIYELVINNDPTVAYLVRTNSTVEQKLVMAHVFGHADFFRHNVWFAPTDRRMLDRMADHGTRLRDMIDELGQDRVETFLDRALTIDSLIDPFLPLARHLQKRPRTRGTEVREANRCGAADAAARATLEEVLHAPQRHAGTRTTPTYDVIGFLVERAPLEPWQREILEIVRAEAYYFAPQRTTRIMNEGWASFWHSRILTGGVLDASELVDFADCHSGATAASPGQLNPYKLGIDLYRSAEARGMDLFKLRRVHNDASFVDELVDEEFAARNQLFVYGRNGRTGRTEVLERSFREVKEKLLQELAWGGQPQIELVDDDREGKGELELVHRHDGRDLQLASAAETLKGIAELWGAPVHLTTMEEGQPRLLTSDGTHVKSSDGPPSEPARKSGAG